METIKRVFRIKRDMSDIVEIIPAEESSKPENIPVEKIMSAILHKIITQKEDDTVIYEREEKSQNSSSLRKVQ